MEEVAARCRVRSASKGWLKLAALVMCAGGAAACGSNDPGSGTMTSMFPAGGMGGGGGQVVTGNGGGGGLAQSGGMGGAAMPAGSGGGAGGTSGSAAGSGGATAAGSGGTGAPQAMMDGGVSSDAAVTADASADAAVMEPPATVDDFAQKGPYSVMRLTNQGSGTVRGGTAGTLGEGGDDASAFTVWIPQGLPSGAHVPLLTWGNGTFCSPTFYDELMDFIVSYGYVVVATNTSNAGSGEEMLQAVDWALAENDKADSPLHDLIDPDAIGAFGHSQGGEGSVNAAADARIRAVAPLSAGPMGSGEAKIQCPAFYTLTASDVVTPDSYRASYDATTTPSVYGVTSGGDHLEYCDTSEDPHIPGLTSDDAKMTRSAITAWFEWQLKDRPALQPLFVGQDCGYCNDPNWGSFESKGF